jgi:hypothetical protein
MPPCTGSIVIASVSSVSVANVTTFEPCVVVGSRSTILDGVVVVVLRFVDSL